MMTWHGKVERFVRRFKAKIGNDKERSRTMAIFFRDKAISWVRNARTLACDGSFSRNVRIMGMLVLLSVACFVALWYLGVGIKAELYNQDGSRHVLTFHEYLFSVLGAIDADPDAAPVYAMYSAFIRLVGAILIGGVLTSFLCSLLSRFSDMTLRGLLVPALGNHTVIVGFTALTDDLIRTLLSESEKNSFENWCPYRPLRRKRKGKILLYTSGDVQNIRDTLNSVLDSDMERRIVYAFGDMDMTNGRMAEEVCQKLSLLRAKSVIILGDASDPGRGDLKNLAFASVAGGYVRKHRLDMHKKKVNRMGASGLEQLRFDSENTPIPFYVQMDDISTFGLIKHMEYKIGSRALREGQPARASARESVACIDLGSVGVYIRPFSYYEGWARAMWGAPYPLVMPKRAEAPRTAMGRLISGVFKSWKPGRAKPEVESGEEPSTIYYPLDFRPMGKESHVHLVVVGLSSVGEALVVEAIRICHYPNGKNTVVTVIDSNPDAAVDFHVHHPELSTLEDVSIEFRCERLQSESARSFISGLAQDRNCILTVAICLRHIESTMFEGLCLPREVYYAYEAPCRPDGGRTPNHVEKRQSYRKYPPRVLVYQEHVNGNPEDGESSLPVRYRFVRPFGMQEQGLQTRCMRSFASMYLNAAFFWPLDADGKSILDLMLSKDGLRGGEMDGLDDVTEKMVLHFRERWKDALNSGRQSEIPVVERYKLLKHVLSLNDAMLAHFKKYAFRRFIMMEPVKEWGNVYVPDSYGTVLRSIGLEAELPTGDRPFNEGSAGDFSALCDANEQCFEDAVKNAALERSLEEVEHRRWVADRVLMGYRPSRPDVGEVRDDGYRYHNSMCPYSRLSDADKNKDELVIRFIPLFMALEGLKIKPMGRSSGDD